jgi:predicted transcriptional regulator
MYLASLIPQVRCECQQGLSRWQAETQAVLPQRPELDKTRAIHQRNPEINRTATTENGVDRKSDPALSDRQYNLLQAMYELEAFHADSKQTTLAIANKAEGPNVNPETFKEPIAELKRLGLVDTKEGRKGGCWLTSKGKRLIKKVRKL